MGPEGPKGPGGSLKGALGRGELDPLNLRGPPLNIGAPHNALGGFQGGIRPGGARLPISAGIPSKHRDPPTTLWGGVFQRGY